MSNEDIIYRMMLTQRQAFTMILADVDKSCQHMTDSAIQPLLIGYRGALVGVITALSETCGMKLPAVVEKRNNKRRGEI